MKYFKFDLIDGDNVVFVIDNVQFMKVDNANRVILFRSNVDVTYGFKEGRDIDVKTYEELKFKILDLAINVYPRND